MVLTAGAQIPLTPIEFISSCPALARVTAASCFGLLVQLQPEIPIGFRQTTAHSHSNLRLIVARAPNAGTVEEHTTSTQIGGLNQQPIPPSPLLRCSTQ